MDQLEGSLLSEKSAVEERAAQSAAEPLKRCLERKETALRSMKLKLEAVQAELSGSRAELEGAKAEVTKREVRARKQSETALAALSVQLDRAHTDRDELRLLIHQIAHAIEQKRTSRGAAEAAGQRRAVAGAMGSSALRELGEVGGDLELAASEDMQVSALAHSLLQLSPEQLGLRPRTEIGGEMVSGQGGVSENAPPQLRLTSAGDVTAATSAVLSTSRHQKQLRTALSEPIDAQAAFTIFSRLLQQLSPSGAAQQRGTDEAVQQALQEYEAMLRQIRSQVVTEKADYEVKLAQRDRVIAGLRVRLQEAGVAGTYGVGHVSFE